MEDGGEWFDAQTQSLSCSLRPFSGTNRSRMNDVCTCVLFVSRRSTRTLSLSCLYVLLSSDRISVEGRTYDGELENRSVESHLETPLAFLSASNQHLMSPRRITQPYSNYVYTRTGQRMNLLLLLLSPARQTTPSSPPVPTLEE